VTKPVLTVGELIKRLRALDPTLPVVLKDDTWAACRNEVEIDTVLLRRVNAHLS
jgi:hypothetical protein